MKRTKKVKHDILLSILENSVSRGYIVQDLNRKSLEIFNIIKELYEDSSLTKLISINNIEEKENELSFFYFCRQLLIPETTSTKDKVFLGEKFRFLKDNEIVDFSVAVLEALSEKFHIKYDVENIILYESIINTWAYQNIYFENLNVTTNQYSHYSRINEVRNIIFNIVSSVELKIGDKDLFASKLAHILSYLLPVQNKETIVIAISMLHHPEYVPVIQNKLLAIFNEKIIKFSSNYSEADILVSDGILNHDNLQDFAFFRDIHNKDHWDNLNSVVQARITSKLG